MIIRRRKMSSSGRQRWVSPFAGTRGLLLPAAMALIGCVYSELHDPPLRPAITNSTATNVSSSRLALCARDLLAAIESYRTEGFHPEAYDYSLLKAEAFKTHPDGPLLLGILRRSFSLLVEDVENGRVDPRTLGKTWSDARIRETPDTADLFEKFLDPGAFDFRDIDPQDGRFEPLRAALRKYLTLEARGGWPTVERISSENELLRRLSITGDGKAETSDPAEVDLREALAHFQRRHGLQPDGILGRATLEELNVPVEARISQLRANLERWRWLPRTLEERYIEVNIPAFQLDLYESGRPRFRTRAIVGDLRHPTPVLRSEISRVEINPYWNVPKSIAVHEILPTLKKDPGYLSRHQMIVTTPAGEAIEPPKSWEQFSPDDFPFRLRQLPGPWNAVGRLKFVFGNRFGVYVHGTPMSGLFEKRCRGLSHGCVRIEDPLSLAEFALSGNIPVAANIEQKIASGRSESLQFQRTIPIYLNYWTAWVDDEGDVHFAKDLYGTEKRLRRALRPPPTTAPSSRARLRGETVDAAASPRTPPFRR